MTKLKAILIDDDTQVIQNFEKLINNYFHDEIELLTCYTDGFEAISFLTQNNVDVVFLDIEMPEMDGFELINLIPKSIESKIIIVSGKDTYALKAIKHFVFDYLMKPISPKDLRACINNVKLSILENKKIIDGNVLIVNRQDKIVFINIESINCIEASGSYTNIYYEDKQLNSSKNLKHFEHLLELNNFIKINRSYIININSVKEILKYDGEGSIILNNGMRIEISRITKEVLMKLINL